MFAGCSYITNLECHYNGRIMIFWRNDYYQVTKVTGEAQSITCLVEDKVAHTKFHMTTVYAFNTREERRLLWNHLWNQSIGISRPWIILGDFNSVLQVDDRIGGNPISLGEVIEFRTCVEECD